MDADVQRGSSHPPSHHAPFRPVFTESRSLLASMIPHDLVADKLTVPDVANNAPEHVTVI